jgi:hypothetical protein
LFAVRLEAVGSSLQPNSKVRDLVNQAYERVVNGMVSSLDTIARESDLAGDDKEQLNAHVMIVGTCKSQSIFLDPATIIDLLPRQKICTTFTTSCAHIKFKY